MRHLFDSTQYWESRDVHEVWRIESGHVNALYYVVEIELYTTPWNVPLERLVAIKPMLGMHSEKKPANPNQSIDTKFKCH